MTLLNQIVAIEKGVKADSTRAVTDAHRRTQVPSLLFGLVKTYEPLAEDGEKLPGERTLLQLNAEDAITEVGESLTRLFDVVLTKESANCLAKADVVVDGNVLVKDAPVTYLLFLEKQLTDVRTFVSKLPVLDPSEKWTYSEDVGAYVSEPDVKTRGKKVPRVLVKAKATDKHPEQTEVWYEDVVVGNWTTVKHSGAVSETRRRELLGRVDKLLTAVKYAREQANTLEITDVKAGKKVFDYLFAR